MRKLTLFIAVALFISCVNKEAEIKKMLWIYKDSSLITSKAITQLSIDDAKKQKELFFTNGSMDLKKYSDQKNKELLKDFKAYQTLKKDSLEFKYDYYKGKIDSLELELKKY